MSDDRMARQAVNLARHLNADHPDTVLFLARHVAGCPDAAAAELVAAGDDLELVVDGARHPLPLAAGSDLRSRVGALLEQTRRAWPGEPLTSLEQRHAAPVPRGLHARMAALHRQSR